MNIGNKLYCTKSFSFISVEFIENNIYTIEDIYVEEDRKYYKLKGIYLTFLKQHFITLKELRKQKLLKLNENNNS